jgi:hypothetical protein
MPPQSTKKERDMLKKVLVSALVAATMAASAMAQSGEPATIPNGLEEADDHHTGN